MDLNITLNLQNPKEVALIRDMLDKLQHLAPGTGYIDVVHGESPAIPVTPDPQIVSSATPDPQPVAAPQSAVPQPETVAAPAAVPTVGVQTYTLDALSTAAAPLIDAGPAKIKQLQDLLAQFGVRSLQELPAEQYGAMANALRVLGARL